MLTYEITFDGAHFSIDAQNLEKNTAMAIMDILHRTAGCAGVPIRVAGVPLTYGELANNAWTSTGKSNIIMAIKELRTLTGLGLKESKDLIDFVSGRTTHMPANFNEIGRK